MLKNILLLFILAIIVGCPSNQEGNTCKGNKDNEKATELSQTVKDFCKETTNLLHEVDDFYDIILSYSVKEGNSEIIIEGDIDSEDEAVILYGLINTNFTFWELPKERVKVYWNVNKNY